MGLERVGQVAQRLRLPRAGLRTITVGGTNGKGSTTTLLAGIYQAAGYRVGCYTSPHLLHYAERIRIHGEMATDAQLCAAFAQIEAARGDVPLTYFEFGTLAALLLFAETQVDVQLLEVGLGGRLDAVNLVDADAAIVTNIGLDHQDWLGDTLDAIGGEKAGIFRKGRPAICAQPVACAGLIASAQALGADLLRRDLGDFRVHVHAEGFDYHCPRYQHHWLGLPLPALAGAHQIDNAAGALTAVASLQALLPVPEVAIRSALVGLQLTGRLQRHGRFLLDVGHNAEAAAALAKAIAQQFPNQRLLWLAGMLQDKPQQAVAAALKPVIAHAYCISLPPPRGTSAEALQANFEQAGLAATAFPTAEAALLAALADACDNQPILLFGSFHTVASFIPLLPSP